MSDATFAAPLPAVLPRQDVPPVLLVFGVTALAFIWGRLAGLHFTVPPAAIVVGPLAAIGASLYYARRHARISEIALYTGLWLLYPAFGVELTYLATRLNLPLRDQMFAGWDAALGFDWMAWAKFVLAHPWFKAVGDAAYASCFWQPLVAIPALAWAGPKGANGRFLTAIMLGLLLVTIVYGALPAIGPADLHHIKATGQVIQALRAGNLGPYVYTGVVAFPSFHTVMAILFTLAVRSDRRLLAGFGLLNLAMLGAVPFQGDHYLCDMIVGAMIAAVAFAMTQWLYRRMDPA